MMKGIYLVAILYVATLGVVALNESPVADIPTDCPDVNPRNITVFVPHETDCTKFYSCHMGKKGKPLDCPFMDKEGNRLHFNPRLQVCDWPWSAGCKVSSSTPTPTTSSPTSPTPSPTSPTPTTPSPTSPTPTTPSPTSPTPTTPSPTSPTPTTPSPTSPMPTTPSPTSPTPTTPSPTSPTPTTPLPTSPTPTTPSPTSPTPTTPSPTSPTPTTPSPTSPTPTTTLPTSPTPTTPSPTSPAPTTPSSSSPTPTTPSSSSCEFDGIVHLIPHKTMCDYYYSCLNGVVNPTAQKCDRDLLFNPVLRVCDYPENVKCSSTIPPSTDIVPSTIRSLITIMTSQNPPSTPQFFPLPTKSVDPSAWICEPSDKRYKVPHEFMCDHYYWCVNGRKGTEPVKCESNLLFNPVVGECDWPENVDCKTTTKKYPTTTTTKKYPTTPTTKKYPTTTTTKKYPTTSTTTEPPTTTTTKKTPTTTKEPTTTPRDRNKPREKCPPRGSTEKARIAHPCLCNQYYECIDGEKILETCPIGKHFDYVREVCDWASIVKCIRPIPPFDIPIDNYDTTCAPEGRAFQHETDCSAYYLCSKGEKILKHCIEGLHFNISIQMCDYPQKKCDLTTPLPTVTLSVCPPAGSLEKIFLPHECECTQYYECIDGKQTLRDCLDGLHYDYVRQICSEPNEAKCVNLAPTVPTKWSSSNPDSDRCYDEDSEMPHEYNCSSYYKCNNGKKILKTCPRNLYFNSKLRVCDFPENVACDTGSANLPTMPTSTKCRTTIETTKIPHEIDCNLYYVCENGINTLKKCHSPELVFNPVLKVCDFPENYICNLTHTQNDLKEIDETIIQNLDPSTCIGTCPEEDPEYAVLLSNDDCKKFCMCSNGFAWVQLCPKPLYFDSVQKICKGKKDAVCGKRSFSQDDTLAVHNVDEDKLLQFPSERSNDERGANKNSWSKLHFYNLDPSTCIGTCPEEDPEYAVLLPNDDCKKFCMCSNGLAYVQPCPQPLYFDSEDKVCKQKKDAVCAVRSFDRSLTNDRIFDENDSTMSLSEENYSEREIYNNPWYKRRFYNVEPSTCIGICPDEEFEYAILLPHEDCRKFCMCSNGLAYVQLCPEPLYFHSVDKVCRRKTHAVCAIHSFKRNHATIINREDEEDNSMEFFSEESNNKRKRHNYLWPKPYFYNFNPSTCIGICSEYDSMYTVLHPNKDCKKFCICNNGVTWIQSCPEPLYFDSIHKMCKQKRDAVCAVHTFSRNHAVTIDKETDENDRIEILSEENTDENEICDIKLDSYNLDTCIGICSDEDNAALLPNLDCRKFCICSSGQAWVQSCPELFYFDSVDKICKWKKNAICAINLFNKNRAFIFNKVDENNSIVPLSKKKHHEHTTRDNIWFKLYSSTHQSHNNMDPSTCIGACPEEDPEYAVLLSNDDCKKFCMCSNGFAWVMSCPEPLYFDSVQKICKGKKDAVCGKRLFSQDDAFRIDTMVENDNSLKSLVDGNKYGIYNNPSTCIGTCPEEDPEYAVLLPNDDCKKFCMCSNGFAWVQSCPEPLYFDSVQKICKVKKDAVCGKRLFNQDDAFRIDRMVDNDNLLKSLDDGNNNKYGIYNNLDPFTCIGTCPEEDPEYVVLLPNDNCKKFCMCSNGFAWVQSCPDPLYFDSVEKICKGKKDAVCGKRLFSQYDVFKIDTIVENDNSLKFLADKNKYGIYNDPFTCIGTCPKKDPEYAVLLPNDDCKKFCMCSNGFAWVMSCPEPLYFDSVEKICKGKKDAVCGKRIFSQDDAFSIDTMVDNDNLLKSLIDRNNEHETYNNLDPSTCIGTCPEEDPEYAVLLPNDDCKKFCMCSNGFAWVMSCPEPLYFDSVQKICKVKKDAVCGKRLFSQDDAFSIDTMVDNDNLLKPLIDGNNEHETYNNLDPSTCIGTCPEEDPEYAVLLPNDDCKKFCMCSNGFAWVMSCPEPLYFDSVQKICKVKKDAVCGKRLFSQDDTFRIDRMVDNDNSLKSLTDGNNNKHGTYNDLDPSTCIGTCPEEDPEYAVLLPNDDCKKFCMCSNGFAWVMSCPEPLYFDSVEKICKGKDAVCGKRLFSQDDAFRIHAMVENDNSLKSLADGNKYEIYNNPSTCIGTCPEKDPEYAVLLPNDDCKKFCMCSNGFAWVMSCPEPLYFDSVEKICKGKKDAVCGKRLFSQDDAFKIDTMVENDNSLKSLIDGNNEHETYNNLDPSTCIGTCPEEDPEYAVLVPNDDCKKFCMCSNGIAWVQLCPEPLYFDSIQKICKRKKDAVCVVRLFNEDRIFTVDKK